YYRAIQISGSPTSLNQQSGYPEINHKRTLTMTPRTTLGDRARKARIREREYRQELRKFRKLESITPEQKSLLKKISEAQAGGTPMKTSDLPNWRDLRAMGVVREKVEKSIHLVILTALGVEVATEDDSKKATR